MYISAVNSSALTLFIKLTYLSKWRPDQIRNQKLAKHSYSCALYFNMTFPHPLDVIGKVNNARQSITFHVVKIVMCFQEFAQIHKLVKRLFQLEFTSSIS